MCRAKDHGNRRCPSHTDPERIEAYNEVRREQYANKKEREALAEDLTARGVKFYRGDGVKNAYFQGKEVFDPQKFKEIGPDDPSAFEMGEIHGRFFWSKPSGGGLWTSPGRLEADGTVKTQWTDWSNREDFEVKETEVSPVRLKSHAVVVRIDNNEDVEKLCKEFPAADGGVSYRKMADAGIDGVHLSESGNIASKRAGFKEAIGSFSSWDMDSTVWLRSENISSGKPVKIGSYPKSDYDSPWDDDDDNSMPSMNSDENDDALASLRARLAGNQDETTSAPANPDESEEDAIKRLRAKLTGE